MMMRARVKAWLWAVSRNRELDDRVDALQVELDQERYARALMQRQVTIAEMRCGQYEQLDRENQAERQRLIREVGRLERQLRDRQIAPVTDRQRATR